MNDPNTKDLKIEVSVPLSPLDTEDLKDLLSEDFRREYLDSWTFGHDWERR